MKKEIKQFFERKEVRKDMYLAFFIALIFLIIEGVRKVIEISVNTIVYGATFKDVTDNYSWIIGYFIAIIITLVFLYQYSDVTKSSQKEE